ncbi:MAG: SpoIIE family protein phosphatase [Turicibacter sp.]|nr:SpoIIE family protein phosphatase [Turicibacter sp.]
MNNILLASGSAESNNLISLWLTREGFASSYIRTAESGEATLTKAEILAPDIVITNVELSDTSGFDLCKKLKAKIPFVLVLCISHVSNKSNLIHSLESGADDYVETHDEQQFIARIRALTRVHYLTTKLKDQYAKIEERNYIIERQIEMGCRVQKALIPDIDMDFNDVSILSMYLPAMGVGGDFYNVIPLNESSLGIIMGDVSGHGIAASFLTVTINAMVKNMYTNHFSPQRLLFQLNNELCKLLGKDFDLYACVFYAVIDTYTRSIRFANAGLTMPLFIPTNGEVQEIEAVGVPVGMIENTRYEEQSISYKPSDMLLFYTDGLQDCFYKNQPHEFLARIKDILSERSNLTMPQILENLCRHFCNQDTKDQKSPDDTSLLLCSF